MADTSQSPSLYDIFTGGLQSALDVAQYRALTELDTKPVAQDTQLATKSDSGVLYRTGTAPAATPANMTTLLYIGGGLVALALVVALLRH